MHSAEILPFTGAHFRACSCRARWCISEEGNDQIVGFHGKEAAEFVEPKGFVDTGWRRGEGESCLSCDGSDGVVEAAGMGVIEGFQVFLELEGRFKLEELVSRSSHDGEKVAPLIVE